MLLIVVKLGKEYESFFGATYIGSVHCFVRNISVSFTHIWKLCIRCLFLGDKCHEGMNVVLSSRKFYSLKAYNKSLPLTTRLIQCWSHVNVPSVYHLLPLVPSYWFTLSAPRYYSSHSSNDDDDVNDSAAAAAATANYYQLYERLVIQSPVLSSSQPLSSVNSSLSTEHLTADASLSHVDDSGNVKMVDVGSKSETSRVAVAAGRVKLGRHAYQLVTENRLEKGNVLLTAQLAGIMAAKRTSQLIPLCHNILLTSVDVNLSLDPASMSVVVACSARSYSQTGVEMEALTGVSVAALTVYDMCKSVSHDIVIDDIRLVSKTGGKSDFSH